MNISPLPAAESEAAKAIPMLTLAFSADPGIRWMYPDAERYSKHFPDFARAYGSRAFEHATAYLADEAKAAALWLPPGVDPDEEGIAEVLSESLAPAKLEASLRAFEAIGGYHPREPHWYLAMIGVDPAWQGSGLGSRLLREKLAEIDEQGLPAYLETTNPANLPLYERFGFEIMGEVPGASDGVPTFPMYRSPR